MAKICPKCNCTHDKEGTFCSRKFANSRIWTEEKRKRHSEICKNSTKIKTANQKNVVKTYKKCPFCQELFVKHRKYCSVECYKQSDRKGMSGGYREGSGRSKSGYYKGMFCGSTYELVWLIYELDHGKNPQRFKGYLQNEKIKYFPDFIYENTIIEIKGYHTESVDQKTQLAIDKGYNIILLYKENLSEQFDYVKEKYGTNKFYELYDNYKPKYNYKCNFCEQEFWTDVKRKTDKVYCSQSCSCKGNKIILELV